MCRNERGQPLQITLRFVIGINAGLRHLDVDLAAIGNHKTKHYEPEMRQMWLRENHSACGNG